MNRSNKFQPSIEILNPNKELITNMDYKEENCLIIK